MTIRFLWLLNHICGVMVGVLAWSLEDRGFMSQLSQANDYKIEE